MIQVETLMIGDWVEVTLKGEKIPVQVSSRNSTFMSYTTDGENGHIAYSGVMNPIPVTDKVLEQVAEHKGKGLWIIDFYYLVAWDTTMGKMYRVFSDPDAMEQELQSATIFHVHELQHLLRVIGKGKLADKIKL